MEHNLFVQTISNQQSIVDGVVIQIVNDKYSKFTKKKHTHTH